MNNPPRIRRVARPLPIAKKPPPASPEPAKAVIPIKPVYSASSAPLEGDSGPKVDYAGVIRRYAEKVDNRTSAIRAKCVECSCGVLSEVRNCTVKTCALWPFRNGEDPHRKKRTDGFAGRKASEGEE